MSNSRFVAVEEACRKVPIVPTAPSKTTSEYYGCKVFNRAAMRKYLYKSYRGYAAKVAAMRRRGEWLDTWGMIVDPNKTDEGFAFTLVGCPIAEYAKKYG